jgi:hypothetical protein
MKTAQFFDSVMASHVAGESRLTVSAHEAFSAHVWNLGVEAYKV